MKYFVLFFLFCSLAFSQPDSSQDPISADSLEEDIIGSIAPPTQEQKKSLKSQLKKKPKKTKEKLKKKTLKKNKKKKHKNK